MPLNIYSIFVDPSTTRKSQAIKESSISPGHSNCRSIFRKPCHPKMYVLGTFKTVANNDRGCLLPGEMYDVLFKLLKSHEENATGDVQALCQLFSGEEASYSGYATEKTREIAGNSKIPFATRLVALLNQGHGLLDRFLIMFPKCLRPPPT